MLTEILQTLFDRDLTKLTKEIQLYSDEKKLWVTDKNISNSAGNLCLHLIGNLNAYLGAELGNTGYVRNRPLEFTQKQKDVGRDELLENLEATRVMVKQVLSSLSPAQLSADYPLMVFTEKMTTEWFLVHLATHLNYHLGQINYHRRLLDWGKE
jgi:uncharacterized damage-inducible protein DinB